MHDRGSSSDWEPGYVKERLSNLPILMVSGHESTDAATFASWGADLLKCRISSSQVNDRLTVQTTIAFPMHREGTQT